MQTISEDDKDKKKKQSTLYKWECNAIKATKKKDELSVQNTHIYFYCHLSQRDIHQESDTAGFTQTRWWKHYISVVSLIAF